MLKPTLIVVAIAAALSACGKPGSDASASASGSASASAKTAAAPKLLIAPEDILKVASSQVASGPVITGSIQPERKADLRAEVQSVVMQVLKENGDTVKRGDILVKLDETSIRDNLMSAQEAARSAATTLEQAERNLQRMKTLRASGMTSLQALDDAELKVESTRSELSAAKARVVSAQQQIQRTVVRAPFDGVVSDRKVSAGDTASIGKELLKVIDPASMRFSGRVSTDRIAQVKVGQAVSFRVNGYSGQQFEGKVTRVDPVANDVTRQVEVLVGFSGAEKPTVSGLYAEGNISSTAVSALTLPESAVMRSGDLTYAWQVNGNALRKKTLQIGSRDPRSGNFEIRSGLAMGDVVMRNPNSSLQDGQSVQMAPAKLADNSQSTAGSH
ncbi:efflux RND transporter periplasmic adaptor subunit [Undibacterium squillarum]|uniref:RND transporter n=1 Tax=Undibacterium squillarum TaxID=1131567 RepID=A0ABQ2XXS3_9BURK|nr:efflux RND transporter periplasmic adaptor subunit [Undibacterium squillarum]GGX38725.1 RND transporter [Undibacterium squillarum]